MPGKRNHAAGAGLPACLLLLLVAAGPAAGAGPGDDGDDGDGLSFDFSFTLSNRINVKENFLNTEGSITGGPRGPTYSSPLNLYFENTEIGYSLLVGLGARLEAGSAFSLTLSADSGELKYRGLSFYEPKPICTGTYQDPRCGFSSNGRTIADEARATGFVRELYAAGSLGRGRAFSWWSGKRRRLVGSGYVLDNYSLGGGLELDLDRLAGVPLQFELEGLIANGEFDSAGKRSPLVKLEATWLVDFLEELSLWSAWFRDGDDALAEVLLYTLADLYGILGVELAGVGSRGDYLWLGASGNLVFADATVVFTAALELGWADLTLTWINPLTGQPRTESGQARMLGGMVDVAGYYDLADWLTAGVFFLFLSGETSTSGKEEVGGRYNSFISVYPYITRTNIFFSGGMNQNFSARNISPSGVNGRGVLAPGFTLGADPWPNLLLRLTSALLFSHGVNPAAGSRFYGWELDFNLEWTIKDFAVVLFEADYFLTGGFFDFPKPVETPAAALPASEPDAWKILLGLDFSF